MAVKGLKIFAKVVAGAVALGIALAAPAAAALDIGAAIAKLSAERDRLLAVAEAPGALATAGKLKKGMAGPEVAALRARIAALHPGLLVDTASPVFDGGLEKAVGEVQAIYGLDADGVAGPATLETLNTPAARQAQRIDLNIERLTALAAAVGERPDRFALVNIPAYTLTAYEQGRTVLESKTIVGRPATKTPVMVSRFISLKFNPDWRPAETNLKKFLAELSRGDTKGIASHGLKILDQSGQEVPLELADAQSFRAQGWRFWQPPSEQNALGLLKFEIDDHGQDIYLHDTNERHKFKYDRRAFSSGCVRVERYEDLAAWVMGKDPQFVRERIALGRTAWEKVPGRTPLAIAYLTVLPDATGGLRWFPDVYGQDQSDLKSAGGKRPPAAVAAGL